MKPLLTQNSHMNVCCCCLVTKSCLTLFWPHGLQVSRLLCWRRQWHPTPILLPGKSYGWRRITNCWSLPKPMSIDQWCHPTISSSVAPFSSCPQSFPASGSFQMSQLFASGGQILEFQLQHQSFQWKPSTDLLYDGLVESPCSPRDSQESSPTPQFKSINSSVLSFLYSPTLKSRRDYWKNHRFD